MSFSMTILEGNIGQDPDIKKVGKDGLVANFSLATEYSYKDNDGKKVKETSWHKCVAWNGLAELIEDYTEKGSRVLVTGRIKYEEYEKDGEKKYITKIIVEKIDLIKGKDREDNDRGSSRGSSRGKDREEENDRGSSRGSGKKRGEDEDNDRGSRGRDREEESDRGSRRGKTKEDEGEQRGSSYEDDIPF